ncbi:unnamed protein product, partial [Clonostachys rhizophaga]
SIFPNYFDVWNLGSQLNNLGRATGGYFDLVAFDPRGTGNTIPFNCTDDPVELYALSQVFSQMGNSSDTAAAQIWAHTGALANTCLQRQSEIGEFINTAFVARDLMSVVDALGEDGMLRFWGLSYGSTLGATVSAMFPDRIERVILDGVANMHEYYNGHAEIQQCADTDETFSKIWSTCIDVGAEFCPLALAYNDGQILEQDVWKLVEDLKLNPIALSSPNASLVLDYTTVLSAFVSAVYNSDTWPALATAISLIMSRDAQDGNDEHLINLLQAFNLANSEAKLAGAKLALANLGIRGSDRKGRVSSREQLSSTFFQLSHTSRLLGLTTQGLIMVTNQWKFNAKERYNGPWADIKTKKPILLIGNTLDVLTSIKAARNTSVIFRGSIVVELQAYAHGSINPKSKCLDQITAAYFFNGTIPPNDTICATDAQPWQLPSSHDEF